MNTNIIRFETSDGLELHGLLYLPDDAMPQRVVVHAHGLAGNFYENRFLYAMARAYTEADMGFFTFNNRGHDYMADILKRAAGGWESVRLGAAFETFTECVMDIEGACETMRRKGARKIYLQGHSSGANKIVFHQARQKSDDVGGVVLISPCDDLGLRERAASTANLDHLAIARRMIDEGKGPSLMPEGAYFSYPMSAHTFWDYFHPGSEQDVFPYRNPSQEFSSLASVSVPMLITFGGKGDYAPEPLDSTGRLLKEKAKSSPGVACEVISGANHSYADREDELAHVVANWLQAR